MHSILSFLKKKWNSQKGYKKCTKGKNSKVFKLKKVKQNIKDLIMFKFVFVNLLSKN